MVIRNYLIVQNNLQAKCREDDADSDDHRVGGDVHNDIDGLVYNTFRDVVEGGAGDELIEDAKKFYELKDARVAFWLQKLLEIVFHNSSLPFYGIITNATFGDLLELLREVMPKAKIPRSVNKAKKMITTKFMHDPEDCIMYWKEHGRKILIVFVVLTGNKFNRASATKRSKKRNKKENMTMGNGGLVDCTTAAATGNQPRQGLAVTWPSAA
ncbi:LOW QUALITY PROTEIN: hypothetical protein Cgig2_003531 [Carnegiea gigantea]|uniref:Uncharacterized protein n=1 Tax=Carnegiea gigantea TaxID=171969 RepID=A0A9Q1JJG4_9CARY|nr:LOW QUALITY PROTEIN: hypothetical protein Cgig2_003531 [Carnegiea gigantea]